ncbi:MAG: DUF4124 domain-containing protein [Proteobacteria bacterium]|nr:DUF4124 domain-containing protein [Burkholderiales bacterium]
MSRLPARHSLLAPGAPHLVRFVVACLLTVFAPGAVAQAIFKSVDSAGRVIYSQEPVAGAVTVEKVDVTPKVTVDRPAPTSSGQGAADAKRAETQRQNEDFRQRQQSRESQRQKAMDAVNAAERDVETAQKALEAGQETSQVGDRQGIGGVRSRPTDQYLDRVRKLEADVDAARRRLTEAQARLRDTP